MNKVRTAVIGCGMISNIYIRNLKELFSIIDLTALSDINLTSAQEKAQYFGIEKVMTPAEIAEDKEIELVVNLTPAPAHFKVIRTMLNAGKHVYTEKMFTTDLNQSRELVKLAEEKHRMIAAAPDTVLGAGVQSAKYYLDSGLIGDVTGGFVSITRNQNLNSELYRFLQKEGGAIPYDVGVYYIGALITLLGPVKTVCGYAAPALYHEKELLYSENNPENWTIPGNNVIAAALEFESGALVTVHFNGNTAGSSHHAFELYGTRGRMEVGDPNTFNGTVKVTLPESETVTLPLTHGFNGMNLLEKKEWFDDYGHRGVGAAELAYAIRMKRPNRLSKEYGLHCQEVLQGIDEAARTGTVYKLKSSCTVVPLKPGYYSTLFEGTVRGDAERSLIEA